MVETPCKQCEMSLADNNANIKTEGHHNENRKEVLFAEDENKNRKMSDEIKKEELGPVGPWAGGKLDWSPLGGLTGTRPVVDHYSISRYSEAEWRKHAEEVLCTSADDLHKINMIEYNARRALECIGGSADKNQSKSTLRLAERAHEILRWKTEVERAIEAITEEIGLLETQRMRATQARAVLNMVKSISSECLARRSLREGFDLTHDIIEQELIKEAALVNEVSNLLERTQSQIEVQLNRNRAVKGSLESDWSDKQEALDIDNYNTSLNNRSLAVMFKPAATRLPDNQTSSAGWENAVRELLATSEAVIGQSSELRYLLNGPILIDCIRDLKNQADKVDVALARGIADTQQCIKAMYNELDVVVRRNAESDKLILDIKNGIRGLDKATKIAQTRLDNRLQRSGKENARDRPQFGLLDEVKSLTEQTTTMKEQLKDAESCLSSLIRARGVLERELQVKLKTLYIDKERCQIMRAQYPSATTMTGY